MPGAPTGVTATTGYSTLKVSWTAPAGDGVAITGYRATASPGPATCTTTGETSCVLGGEAGTPYTVTVVALSAGGASAASAPSSPVMPIAPVVAAEPPDTDLPLGTGDGDISTAVPGQELVVTGDGYAPYSSVMITLYSTPIVLATATADSDGAFEQAVTVPAGLSAGTHSFVAAGVDPSGNFRALRLDVTVAADSGSNLPTTGPAMLWVLVAGFGLVLAGVALRRVRR